MERATNKILVVPKLISLDDLHLKAQDNEVDRDKNEKEINKMDDEDEVHE